MLWVQREIEPETYITPILLGKRFSCHKPADKLMMLFQSPDGMDVLEGVWVEVAVPKPSPKSICHLGFEKALRAHRESFFGVLWQPAH